MSRLAPGKSLVFIQVQTAQDESDYNDIFPRYTPFFKWFGFDDHRLIRACGVPNPGDVKEKDEVLKKIEDTVAELFG